MPHPARPTITLHDVAAAAGVSIATASRVLGGGSRRVRPDYEQRVLAAAEELRYTADASARAMRRVSDSITLVADDLTTPSIGIVVAAMEQQARMSGAFVTVSSTGGSADRQLDTVRRLRALRPRALVLTTSSINVSMLGGRIMRELLAYERDGGRVVIVGDTDMPFDSISFDNRGAARTVGLYLAESGHRRVGIVAGSPAAANVSTRTAGLVEGLREGGVHLRDIQVLTCPVSRQGGFETAQRLLAPDMPRVHAIAAANDIMAIGAMSGLRALGVAVPAKVSVTGFDDIQLAIDVTPRLTTVTLPLAQAGAEAIRLATRERVEPAHLVMRGQLVVRGSTVVRAARLL